ncbi:SMP-30/gluconolactonase/LRE family protein [Glacieibacterium sp.]|uniref:SMP-30/gluconolactonase/LRE family protein n=1 Tax=Glacieibacterium sp. TaxID=2860237 RepID=UPI003AFF77AE
MTTGSPRLACRVGAMLGEGPVWVAREQALWFVDIKGHQLHRFDPAKATLSSWVTSSQPGWILPAEGGDFVVGMQSGIKRFDLANGSFESVANPEADQPGNRLNDASTDARGCIWFGSMDDAETALSGCFYSIDATGVRHTGLPKAIITNGPAFSPDGRILYHTDTFARTIFAADLHDDGSVGAPRIFVEIEDGAGYPDGITVDSAGCVWTGLFGGWATRRYAPDGRLMTSVRLPTANVTKIAFGGPTLTTAYATTARKGLDAAALAAQPEAGDLFAFEVDVPGLAVAEARIAA